MIELITICIIFLSAVLTVLIKNTNDAVVEFHKKFETDKDVIIESVKEIRKNLIEINKMISFFKAFKGFKFYKIFLKVVDIINIILLFYPTKKKITIAKRFFSIKFLKQAFALYKDLTA